MTLNENETRIYSNLKYLIINRMELDWSQVDAIVKHFPALTNLKVCFNSITSIQKIGEALKKNLKSLDMESNPINQWENLIKLGELEEYF